MQHTSGYARVLAADQNLDTQLDETVPDGSIRQQVLGRIGDSRLLIDRWDDMLRLAGSLKIGKVNATAVVRTLQRAGSLSGLGRAVAEFGRVEQTLYLLVYLRTG